MRRPRRVLRRAGPYEPSRLAVVDLLSQALATLGGRRGRTALTALGTVAGIAAFIATAGYASTARAQVSSRFDVLRATEVSVKLDTSQQGTSTTPPAFPRDLDQRLAALRGVRAGGLLASLTNGPRSIAATPVLNAPADSEDIAAFAASPGGLRALRPIVTGRLFDSFHDRRGERVLVIGRSAAAQLHIVSLRDQPTVFLDTTAYSVIGILDDVARRPAVLDGVILPEGTALAEYPTAVQDQEAVIDVAPGAAAVIGRQAPIAIDVTHPERFLPVVPPDPKTLRQHVEGDVQKVFFALGLIALAMGMIAIANSTLVAVIERTGEIGLRRAMGARRYHIASQIIVESAITGGIGAAIGTSVGVLSVSAIALLQHWSAVIAPVLIVTAPLAGIVCGILAGLYPAARAARIEPVDALRSA